MFDVLDLNIVAIFPVKSFVNKVLLENNNTVIATMC